MISGGPNPSELLQTDKISVGFSESRAVLPAVKVAFWFWLASLTFVSNIRKQNRQSHHESKNCRWSPMGSLEGWRIANVPLDSQCLVVGSVLAVL